ncbi:MAG: hypothetical protein LRY55_12005 [Leadbetterella sp.]|nr:hypothetical protein [Leadbetterella sp.]
MAYDLEEIFSGGRRGYSPSETLKEDPFLYSRAYADYERYRVLDRRLDQALKERILLPDSFFEEYISLNPELWSVYYKAGKYFKNKKQENRARAYFETALTKEITTLPARREIEKNL